MRVVLAASVIALFVMTMALFACRAQVPKPELGVHVATDRGICVPFPPPAARAEEVPPRVDPASVWIDGEWEFWRRRWQWRPGRWEIPPAHALYARSRLLRLANGALAHFPSHWYTPELAPADAAVDVDRLPLLHCPPPMLEDAAGHDADALTTASKNAGDAGDAGDATGTAPFEMADARPNDEPPWLSDAPLDIIPPPK